MKTASKWTTEPVDPEPDAPSLPRSIAVTEETYQAVLLAARADVVRNRALHPRWSCDIRAAMAAWVADAAGVPTPRAVGTEPEARPVLAEGTMPGSETLHGDRCMCAGAGCRERAGR